jgi:hypothetical protein
LRFRFFTLKQLITAHEPRQGCALHRAQEHTQRSRPSARQLQLLALISRLHHESGHWPCRRHLEPHLGITSSSLRRLLDKIVLRGWAEAPPGNQGVRLTRAGQDRLKQENP